MRGGGYLRFAAAALFLALAAYLGAGLLRESEAPETLRAERVTESRSLCLEGTVIRDERYVTCSDGEAYLPAARASASAAARSSPSGRRRWRTI